MSTTLMNIANDTPAGKAIGPNRYKPQPEATPPADRFATLLKQRQQSQPAAKTSAPPAESRSAPKTPAPRDTEGNAQSDVDGTAEKDADGTSTLQASTGCEATPAHTSPGGSMLPPGIPREKPIAEAPTPGAQIDTGDATVDADAHCELPTGLGKHGANNGDGDVDDGKAAPEAPIAAPPFLPAMPGAAGLVAAAAATGAIAATGGGPDYRAGAGTSVDLAAPAVGLAMGSAAAGSTSAGGHGGNGADDSANDGHAAALLSAASAQTDKALTAPGDRFALPPRMPPIEASPGFIGHAGGIAPRGAEASATAPVLLPTPLHAPDFAKALGAQVSLFARNGLAQAELQLNPADMGPIRVQIAIEGVHARVDFAADAATTRQVIERGLPELASALREQGLTLSGGGVFQRAPDQRGDSETPAARVTRGTGRRADEAMAADSITPSARARTIAALRGGVDLYA